MFILALIDDENVVLSGKFFGRVKLCKQVEANIKGSLPNFTSIFPYPKLGKQGAPVVKTIMVHTIMYCAFIGVMICNHIHLTLQREES